MGGWCGDCVEGAVWRSVTSTGTGPRAFSGLDLDLASIPSRIERKTQAVTRSVRRVDC